MDYLSIRKTDFLRECPRPHCSSYHKPEGSLHPIAWFRDLLSCSKTWSLSVYNAWFKCHASALRPWGMTAETVTTQINTRRQVHCEIGGRKLLCLWPAETNSHAFDAVFIFCRNLMNFSKTKLKYVGFFGKGWPKDLLEHSFPELGETGQKCLPFHAEKLSPRLWGQSKW